MSRNLPQIFDAGSTVEFSASFTSQNTNYTPANGYVLTYFIRGSSNLTVVGTANDANDGWTVKLTSKSTFNFSAGLYEYIARVSKDGDSFTVETGRLTLKANLANVEQGTRVNHVQHTISVLEDAIEGRITADVQQFSIGGRQLLHIPITELVNLRDRYKRELKRLQLGTNRQMTNINAFFGRQE